MKQATTPEAAPLFFVPTAEDVAAVRVGSMAINCWGRWAEVVEVTARRTDINGRPFVCFYTRESATSSVSHSYKAGELLRTMAACHKHNSAQLDAIERQINAERAAAQGGR